MLATVNAVYARFVGFGWPLRGLICFAFGVLIALGHAPYDLWWLSIVVLAVAFRFVPASALRTTLWHGWALGAGYFAMSLRWIISPFLVHVERDGWMAPFAMALMAGGFALFWMLAAGLSQRLWRNHTLAFPLALLSVEVLRSLILTGFPWALLGHVLISTPLAQLAAFGGPHLLTLVAVMLSGALASLLLFRMTGAVALAALAWVLATPPDRVMPSDAPLVRLVQPNAPQEEKWDPVMSQVFLNRMLTYTSAGAPPDLVVWPESAIPALLNNAQEALDQIADAARGAPVIVGVNRREAGLFYNSFITMGRGGLIDGFYDKQHLVPFGEYVPGGDLLHQIGIRGFGSSYGGGFTSGTGQRTLEVEGIGAVRPLICYEGIFAEEVGTADDRPRALVLITNDAWFGKDAGPLQHLAQARLRAIEQGLPMVRVANTGVSAMIDAQGRITASIGLNRQAYLDVRLPPAAAPTLYSRYGELPLQALLILAVCGLTLAVKRNSVDHIVSAT